MRSLESRLHFGLFLSLALLSGLVYWGGTHALRQLAESMVTARLEHDAEALLGTLRPGRQHRRGSQMSEPSVAPVYLQPFSGHYYLMQFADGELLRSRSLWDYSLALPPLRPIGLSKNSFGPGIGGHVEFPGITLTQSVLIKATKQNHQTIVRVKGHGMPVSC